MSDIEITKVRRDSGELEPFILDTIHLIESPNRLPPSYLIGRSVVCVNMPEVLGPSQ